MTRDADWQRLLAVVEAGFGSFEGFNTQMREVFDEHVLHEGSVSV